jgi:autophagy-related protein 9
LAILIPAWAFFNGFAIKKDTVFDPNKEMMEVAKHTQYYPESWKNKAHTETVRAEFKNLYSLNLFNFVYEILSIFLIPYVLIFSIYNSSEKIIKFLNANKFEFDSSDLISSFRVKY